MQKNSGFQHPVDGRKGNAPGATSSKANNRHPGVAKESATNGSPKGTGGMKAGGGKRNTRKSSGSSGANLGRRY